MGMFANNEGKHGGEFYTPRSIVKLLVEMLEPYKGRVYDPCCGSGGMFVWSEKFIAEHAGRIDDIAVYGQELNETTWRLAKMNMAIRGIDADIRRGDTLTNDQLPDLKADYIIANPPFNISDWGQEHLQDDIRWKFGIPPKSNANYAWIQHFIHHLSPRGTAGFVLANGSMSSQSGGEGEIRKQLVLNDMVDCIVTLPSQLFFNVAIPCCLWFVSRERSNRHGKVLFIDGRNLGKMINRKNRELTEEDIAKVSETYHNFKTQNGEYVDVPGFAKVANLDEIKEHDFVLTPGRYVGAAEVEEDEEAFEEKMQRLTADLNEQFAKSHELEAKIKENLKNIELASNTGDNR
jgi:type I restriction enzyme M protein